MLGRLEGDAILLPTQKKEMAMRTMIVLAMALGLYLNGWVAFGQDDQRRALAEELLNEMNLKDTVEKSFEIIKKMIPMQTARMNQAMEKTDSPLSAAKPTDKAMEKVMAKMMDMVAQELSWDKLKEDYITVYAETFTAEELQGAIAFYKSPAGKAFTKKQPELMKRSMELSQKQMARVMPKILNMSQELQKQKTLERKKNASQPKKMAPPPKEMAPPPKEIAPPEEPRKVGE
jgi:uncharacterized protein